MKSSGFAIAGLLLTAIAAPANASVLYDSGVVTFSATGSQFGRISRDGVASVWGVDKAFPGVIGAPTARDYEEFSFVVTDREFLQISLDDETASFFMAAYLTAFTPVNSPPNYGFDVNYLGDPGLSQPFGNPSSFQIQVAQGSTIVIPISEINPGGGAGQAFELLIEGFYDSSFSEVPEPGSIILCGVGTLLLLLRYRRARSGASLS